MNRKLMAVILSGALAASIMTPFSAAAADDTILLWVPEATQTFTEQQIEAFKEANPDYAGYTYKVEPVGDSGFR